MAMYARIFAFAVGVLGLASLRAQYDALAEPVASLAVLDKLWRMAGYFTILTNFLVTFHMLAVARGWRINARQAAGLVVPMVMVGLVYHAVLARLWAPVGLAWWANQGLHTAMPLATLFWWLAFAPKAITRRDLPYWLIWPAVYCGYALIRGQVTGFWAYPFLNADLLGWGMVTANILGLMIGFVLVGLGVLGLASAGKAGIGSP